MKREFTLLIVSFAALCTACSSSSDDSPSNSGGGGEPVQATYRLTFEPNFTDTFYPTDYPDNPGFIRPVVIAHGSETSVFKIGNFASPGLKLYAEEGDATTLISENTPQEDNEAPTTIVQGSSDIGPTQAQTYTIIVTPTTTLLSFVAKLTPSPDWFLGMDTFDLVGPNNVLIENASAPLFVIDAGTDAGESYMSDNSPENKAIVLRTGPPFTDEPDEIGKSVGQLQIERIN